MAECSYNPLWQIQDLLEELETADKQELLFILAMNLSGENLVSIIGAHLDLPFAFCEPCDTETPTINGACAACATNREE